MTWVVKVSSEPESKCTMRTNTDEEPSVTTATSGEQRDVGKCQVIIDETLTWHMVRHQLFCGDDLVSATWEPNGEAEFERSGIRYINLV